MSEYLVIIVGALSAAFSSIVSWFLSKAKYKSEVKSSDIDNLQKSLEFYKALSDDNKLRLTEILEENKEMKVQISELRGENEELKYLVREQSECINDLKDKVNELTEVINNLNNK